MISQSRLDTWSLPIVPAGTRWSDRVIFSVQIQCRTKFFSLSCSSLGRLWLTWQHLNASHTHTHTHTPAVSPASDRTCICASHVCTMKINFWHKKTKRRSGLGYYPLRISRILTENTRLEPHFISQGLEWVRIHATGCFSFKRCRNYFMMCDFLLWRGLQLCLLMSLKSCPISKVQHTVLLAWKCLPPVISYLW